MRLTHSPTRQRGWSIQSAGSHKPHHHHIINFGETHALTHSHADAWVFESVSQVAFYVVVTRRCASHIIVWNTLVLLCLPLAHFLWAPHPSAQEHRVPPCCQQRQRSTPAASSDLDLVFVRRYDFRKSNSDSRADFARRRAGFFFGLAWGSPERAK